jgi:amino acid adenylation domain-containing protein
MSLRDLVISSANRFSDSLAVKAADGCLTYGELDGLANRFAHAFLLAGVQRGDRVGIWLEKSTYTVAAMQGVLRVGAVYVPLDPLSPAARIYSIVRDCEMYAVVTTQARWEAIRTMSVTSALPACICLDGDGSGLMSLSDEPVDLPAVDDEELAYILYTSGSTGVPKGVCISNRNALAFIGWAVAALNAVSRDRFVNHAPFHFDLSVLDLYAAFAVGASVLLIPEEIAYLPRRLVDFVREEQPTIWYSVPSVLTLMMEQGGLFDRAIPSLRAILFAGEPFPIKQLRRLYEQWPGLRFLNLYGPTETNVCTFYEVTALREDWKKPVPIGRACSGDRVWVQKEDGTPALLGEEGELMVTGPTVMSGYWGRPKHGNKPYATGDLVRLQEDGNYVYIGRRDHMVKIRGYRVEPGDIEAALEEHPAIHEAVVLVDGVGIEARLVAFVACSKQEVPSLLEIKRHCAERLPRYMIIDAMQVLRTIPRTGNGKVNRLALKASMSKGDL